MPQEEPKNSFNTIDMKQKQQKSDNHGMSDIPYHLSLSDGSHWQIAGDELNALWVDELAKKLEIKKRASKKPSNGLFKLFFYHNGNTSCKENEQIKILRDLKNEDSYGKWHCSDHETMRIWYHTHTPYIICEFLNNYGREIQLINMWNALQPIYQQSMSKGGLPFHAALVELQGRGFLLCSSGGKGKSTCCRRLPDRWQPWCDDETLVVLNQDKQYQAHPFPTWSDYLWQHSEKTWNVQHHLPLSGIFFLEQSDIDNVTPVGEGQAVILMNEAALQICQKFWKGINKEAQRAFRREIFSNACKMAKQIPAYRLDVSRHGRFWEKMEQVIEG